MNEFILNKYIQYIKINFEYSEEDLSSISYSFMSIIGETEKFLMLWITFLIAGKQAEFLITFIAMTTIRIFAGGYHAKTFLKCFCISLVLYSACIFLPGFNLSYYVYVFILVVALTVNILFAPVSSVFRPRRSKNVKLNFKIKSTLFIIFYIIVFIILHKTDSPYATIIFWTICLQNLQILILKGGEHYENIKKNIVKLN